MNDISVFNFSLCSFIYCKNGNHFELNKIYNYFYFYQVILLFPGGKCFEYDYLNVKCECRFGFTGKYCETKIRTITSTIKPTFLIDICKFMNCQNSNLSCKVK